MSPVGTQLARGEPIAKTSWGAFGPGFIYVQSSGGNVPDAPTNPAAAEQSCSSILVSWDDVADETGYRVERSPDGSGSWVDVSGNLAADATSYLNTGLSESTQYFYRVIAFNANGDSAPSTVVNDTTPACPPTPPGGRRVIRSPRYGVTRVAS